MRQAVGTTWILGLVIVFILIFASYLALTISYQKTFKVKNEVISFIEREEGITDQLGYQDSQTNIYKIGSIQLINNYLRNSGYRQKGSCPQDWIGATSIAADANKSNFEKSKKGTKYYYCIRKYDNSNKVLEHQAYYKVKLFYKFDLPFLGDIITFEVDGETNDVPVSADEDFWKGF